MHHSQGRNHGVVAVVLGAALTLAPAVLAQNINSRLTGTAKDAQGAVLPGVTVTATSPSLIGTRVAVTEANGTYSFSQIPPGTYTLKFELSGFQTLTRPNIVLPLGQTLTVDATLQVATLQESVTVTAESPLVDTQSTSVGQTLDTAKLVGVPSSSDTWGSLARSPGVRMRGFDVGGSHKSQQSGYEAYGIRQQNRIVTEGVDTTEGNGFAGGYWDYFAEDEVSVSSAGQDVEMNTPGAAVFARVKSGGNTFKGLVHQTYEPNEFVADNTNANITRRGGSAAPNKIFWENHDDFGGPVLKDHLWLFGAYNHFKIDKVISGVDPKIASDLMTNNTALGKATWKPTSQDTLIGFYEWQKKAKPTRGLSATRPKESTLAQFSPGWMFNGKWDRVWSDRLFSELNIGKFGFVFPEQPSVDFRTRVPRHDLVTSVDSGAGFTQGGTAGPFVFEREKPQGYAKATYYLPTANAGSHDLKVGAELLEDQSDFGQNGASGPILYLDSNGATDEIRLTDVGTPQNLGKTWTVPSDRNRRFALYGQDHWLVNNSLTITGGVRWDRQRLYYIKGKRDPVLTDFFQQATIRGKTLFVHNNVAPRVGGTYSPTGNGRTAIKAFWGRYYNNFADDLSPVDPVGSSTKTFKFNDLDGDRLFSGPQEIGALLSATGGLSTRLDPNLKTPHTDEVDVSYQQQFWGESAIRFAYVRKMSRNAFDVFNAARVGQFTVPTPQTVTLRSIDQGVTGTQTFAVNDIPASLKGVVDNVEATIPASEDFGNANYDTIEAQFNKRFGTGLFLDTSFDWTHKNELRSNSASNNPLTQSDTIGTGFFLNVFPSVPNRQRTTQWEWHFSSRYQFKYDIGVAANFNVQSGFNYARLITVSLPNSGVQRFFVEDLDNHRSDTVPLLNLRFDKGFALGGGHRVTGFADLFNILNSSAITNFNLFNGSRFNQINKPLDPFTLEIGGRFEF